MTAYDPKRTSNLLAPSRKTTVGKARGTTAPRPTLTAQAVEGYVLYCLTYIQSAAIAARVMRSVGSSPTKQRILGWATLTPGVTVGELVTRLRITHQGANAPLRELINEGYVVAKVGAEDRRQKRLYATRKGSQSYTRHLVENVAKVEKAFRAVGPAAARGFLEVHRRMLTPRDREWAKRAARIVGRGKGGLSTR
jgi:DNA-binding MarR family transcriptional regulator